MIRVDIMFGASSTRYNLLFLKKYPIRYEDDLLTAAWSNKLSKRKQKSEDEKEGDRSRELNCQ